MTDPKLEEPLKSPTVPGDGADPNGKHDTGTYPATHDWTRATARLEVTKGSLAIVVGLVLAGFFAYRAYAADVKEKVDAGVNQVAADLKATKEDLKQHKAEEAQHHMQQMQVLNEIQLDQRALYRSVLSRQPSPRLERPPALPKPISLDGGVVSP